MSRVGYDPGDRGRIPCRLRVSPNGLYGVEVISSTGEWVVSPFRAVFREAMLKTAVEELVAAWQGSSKAARGSRPDWQQTEWYPELTYTKVQADGTHKEAAKKRPIPAPPGRAPASCL